MIEIFFCTIEKRDNLLIKKYTIENLINMNNILYFNSYVYIFLKSLGISFIKVSYKSTCRC